MAAALPRGPALAPRRGRSSRMSAGRRPRGTPRRPGTAWSPCGPGRTAAGAWRNPAGGFPPVSDLESVCNDSRRGKLMANSPLRLNTENPVTSSRIKYTHARTHTHTEASPRGNAFKSKHRTPYRRRDPHAGAFLRLRPLAQRGPGPEVGRPETALFCLLAARKKQVGAGEGKARRDPSGRGNGEEQKQSAALSSLPRTVGTVAAEAPWGCRPGGSLPHPVQRHPEHRTPETPQGRIEAATADPQGKPGPKSGRRNQSPLPLVPAAPRRAA